MTGLTRGERRLLRGMFGGRCAYCGCELPEKGWHADHVKPVVRKYKMMRVDLPHQTYKLVATGEVWNPENQRSDNYFPSCAKCNIEKGAGDLEAFRRSLEHKIEVLRNNSAAFRHAERFGLVSVVKTAVVFYFETLAESGTNEPEEGVRPDQPALL